MLLALPHFTLLLLCAGNTMATKVVKGMTCDELWAWLKENNIDESYCNILTKGKICCLYYSYLLLKSAGYVV